MSKRTLEVMEFTDENLGKLGARMDGKERIVRCRDFNQLVVAVTPKGKKTLGLYTKEGKRPKRDKICDYYPGIDLEQVRKEAVSLLNKWLLGIDTSKKTNETLTFSEIFYKWKTYALARNKRTIDFAEYNFKKYLQPIHNKKLNSITVDDIAAITNKIVLCKTPRFCTANRAVELISRMFNFARKQRLYDGHNPASTFEKFPEQPSNKFMSAAQFRTLIETAKKEKNAESRDIILFMAYTFARVNCCARARFEEFCLISRTWTIPSMKSKNGKEMVLPLNDAAIHIVMERRKTVKGEYLFGHRGLNKKPIWVNRIMTKLCKKAGIGHFPVHALRKSAGSIALSELKMPLYEVSQLLGHSTLQVTQKHYGKLAQPTLTKSSNDIANALG